ncbi:NAD(P)-binding domain-containing protein [Glycomyces algeriensis]|uniref:NAD(P)-binding domain-containing protein n=1 Tax=Glycomyces algeriensis TaxID=256037 RepID=UPI0022D76872|nr:NAD(P)-binding domain-containing protein [Glycomyces algeriensis]MDA1365032.1 NAD(P)-binding domain-containing protein [Glycomyces algeriensis]MDR7349907.1 cation diffusion facilitator CzcD-associated flavoprotein CzcO [Glycomyces algeriensis]
MNREVEVVVIGAGQAGLSAAYYLRRHFAPGTGFAVLDHAPHAGGAWQFRWPTLTFATVNGVYRLPGMDVPEPEPTTPVSGVISQYFTDYEREFDLRVQRPVSVSAVRSLPDERLEVVTDRGTWITRALINATGTWERPFWPRYAGQDRFNGRQLHTAQYRGPDEFAGRRVAVVGGGISGIQHLLEIDPLAASTHWITRREPQWRSGDFNPDRGREAVAMVEERVRRGLRPQSVISVTGVPMTPAIRAAREAGVLDRLPMFDQITPDGLRWDDGRFIAVDTILWATGFRAALDHLAPLKLRGSGGGIIMDGTRVAADPRVHLVGYGPSASTVGANRAGRAAVSAIRAFLGATSAPAAARV